MKTPDKKTLRVETPNWKDARKTRRSARGQKLMIWFAGAVLVGLALLNEYRTEKLLGEHPVEGKPGPLWPVFLAILAFLYLWWLSSLLFDLLFVWHRYIQGSAAHNFLRENVRRENLSPEGDPPPERPIGGVPADIPPNKPRGGASFTFEEGTKETGSQKSVGA